jgi:hypothetical protein
MDRDLVLAACPDEAILIAGRQECPVRFCEGLGVLQHLHSAGLLRASFRPPGACCSWTIFVIYVTYKK